MTGAMQNMLSIGKTPAGASVSISPSYIDDNPASGQQFTATATATPTGITSPTYLWSWASGGNLISLTNTTSATVTMTSPGRASGSSSGELQCTVSGTGGPKTSSITVNVSWGTGI